MSKIKLLVVTGDGGARADFTAGWLGTLSGFVNSRWLIDPTTGVSYGDMGIFRGIDNGAKIQDLLRGQNVQLDPCAEFTWATAIHGWGVTLEEFKSLILLGSVKFLYIDVSRADQEKIHWEFFVKTYLSHRRQIDSIRGNSEQWVIDSSIKKANITNQDRIEYAKYLMKVCALATNHRSLDSKVPSTVLDYVDLFKPNGSRYLCEQLQITASTRHHQYWDAMLPFSDTLDSVEVWGHTWSRADFN